MPLLAIFLGSLIASLASFFGVWVTKKIAIGAAAIFVYGALTAACIAVIAAGIASISTLPTLPHWVVVGMTFWMPSNFYTCLGLIVTAEGAIALKRWNIANLKLVAAV